MNKQDGPTAWNQADLDASQHWRMTVPDNIAVVMAAEARRVAADGQPAETVNRERYRLPQGARFFEAIHSELEHGTGLVVVDGLPFAGLTYAEKVALTLGVSDHVGRVVPQNYELQRVVDVRDDGVEYSHRSRGYRSNKPLPFHTDGAHLFTLTCLDVAREGGDTILVSASSVYNALRHEDPDSLEVLCRGFYHHRRGQHGPGEAPLSHDRIPVFTFHDGLLHCCYNRNPIEWAEREGVRLSPTERAALDAMDAVLARDTLQLRLALQPGESAFINNFITLHSRTEYRDDDDHRRHLLRVWMTDPESRRDGMSLLQLYVPADVLAG